METTQNNPIAPTEEKAEPKNIKQDENRPGFIFRIWPLLTFILFALAFFLIYIGGRSSLALEIRDISNQKILKIFSDWTPYFGIVFAFLSYIIYLLLVGIKHLVRLKKFMIINPFLLAASVLPWYFFARQLVYFEPRYTDIARAIISFVGEPLLSVSVFGLVLAALWLFILLIRFILNRNKTKEASLAVLLFFCPFLLTGCLGQLQAVVCDFLPDSDHCWQGAGVQEGKSEECEKIKGEGFVGSNPPRDKCYLLIAENTGDLSACDQIKGGLMSYTREECLLGAAVKNLDPSGCQKLSGEEKSECVSRISPKLDPGAVIEIDDQIALIKAELANGSDPDLEKQLKGLEGKREDYLNTMSSNAKETYESLSDPLNREASLDYHLGKIDATTRDTLVALNDSLRAKGDSMGAAEYKTLRDYLAFKNDPKNDIEQMDERELLKLRWNEKLGNAVDYLKFWNSKNTASEEKYDEQLFFYERMLERQAAIEKGLSDRQQDLNRNLDMVKDALKDKVWETAMDEAKKAAFGELLDLVDSSAANPVSTVLGEAIETVKKEAKSAEFRGLVRAYNLGMQEELAKAGGDINRAHEIVTANLQSDPYRYADGNSFAKYGNILENKDCDGSNPHCINRDVFWKAMKKSYKYQNQGS